MNILTHRGEDMDMRCRLRAVRWRLDPPLRGRAPRRGPGRTGAEVAAHRPGGPGPGRRDRGVAPASAAPLVEAAARAQAANALTAVIDRAIAADLAERDVDYGDFVTIQRDASGAITAMTTDMAALNQLRAQLVAQILSALGGGGRLRDPHPPGQPGGQRTGVGPGPGAAGAGPAGGDGVGGIPQRLLPGGGEPDPCTASSWRWPSP